MTSTPSDFGPTPAQVGEACLDAGDELVQRLRAVRRRLARWLPSSEMLALWSNDYHQVYTAASRLEQAVKQFDLRMADTTRGGINTTPDELESLLENVEARAEEFEATIVASVATAN